MKLLHIDSAITGDGSVSRQVTADIVKRLVESNGSIEVTHRDLAADPLGHFTLADLPVSTAEQKSAIRRRKTRPSCYMPGGVA